MDTQLLALGKCVVAGDLRSFIDGRITTEFFSDEQYRRVYSFLLEHLRNYSEPPDEAIVKTSFPNLVLENHPQPTAYFIDQLRERREAVLQNQTLDEAMSLLSDPNEPEKVKKIRGLLQGHLRQAALETSGTRDTTLALEAPRMLERLQYRREHKSDIRGYETGFHGIDLVTGGLQPEQFIVVTGIPKSGKSSFLLRMALTMYLNGLNPLFLGFEMSNDEQLDRVLSLLTGISLTKILNGELDDAEWAKITRKTAEWEGKAPNRLRRKHSPPPSSFFLSADITSGLTVAGIAAKIHNSRPHAVFIDGMYLMNAGDETNYPRGSEASLRLISRDLKKLAQSTRIPIVGTTQSLVSRSRGGLTIASLGYTSAWAQDADVILGVEREANSEYSKFHVLDSRSGPRKDTYIRWDWNTGTVEEIDHGPYEKPARAQAQRRINDGTFDD